MKDLSKCWMEKEPFKQCCCTCKFHVPTYEHCETNPNLRNQVSKLARKITCICGVTNGFACVPPEMDGKIYINWPEHSCGCEMYRKKEE